MSLRATKIGRAVSASGLLPDTASFLLHYLDRNAKALVQLLPDGNSRPGRIDELRTLIVYACLCSREFAGPTMGGTRSIPFPLENGDPRLPIEPDLVSLLADIVEANRSRAASASLAMRWIEGEPSRTLETVGGGLLLGTMRGHFHEIARVMSGLANIVEARRDDAGLDGDGPLASAMRELVARLPRILRWTARRIEHGLPDDVLWMTEVDSDDIDFRLSRTDIRRLRDFGIRSPIEAMDESKQEGRKKAFDGAVPSPTAKNNAFVKAVREWKTRQRSRVEQKHKRRAPACIDPKLVADYYDSRRTDFELAVEKLLGELGIAAERKDNSSDKGAGAGRNRGFADYLVSIPGRIPFVLEVKTKEGDNLLGLNECTEVISAADIMGHGDKPCVTLCHPGYDPSVPPSIVKSTRLCVVEATSFAEALLRIAEGQLTPDEFHDWLTTPGEALPSELPFASARRAKPTSP